MLSTKSTTSQIQKKNSWTKKSVPEHCTSFGMILRILNDHISKTINNRNRKMNFSSVSEHCATFKQKTVLLEGRGVCISLTRKNIFSQQPLWQSMYFFPVWQDRKPRIERDHNYMMYTCALLFLLFIICYYSYYYMFFRLTLLV